MPIFLLINQHLFDNGLDSANRLLVQMPKFANESAFINCANLIQYDPAILALKPDRYAAWVSVGLTCHWRDNHSLNLPIHFLGRNDCLRASLPDLVSDCGIKRYQEDIVLIHLPFPIQSVRIQKII